MNPKLLIAIAWVLYLLVRRTQDDFWLFCLIYCCILALCTLLYRLENKSRRAKDKGH